MNYPNKKVFKINENGQSDVDMFLFNQKESRGINLWQRTRMR